MIFLRFLQEGKEYTGVTKRESDYVIPLEKICPAFNGKSLTEFIQASTSADMELIQKVLTKSEVRLHPYALSLREINLVVPIRRPLHDVLCVGQNYWDHIEEVHRYLGEEPPQRDASVYFTKRAVRILGSDEPLLGRFDLDENIDYEVELAVIIGKEGRDIPMDKVDEYIFGYSILNDFSSRIMQRKHTQWFKGKSVDDYTAMGPWIVTKDEFVHPLTIDLSCRVNGEVRQQSNTNAMMADISVLIHELSQGMTLEPGDIIATGTPSGVGMGMMPPTFLKRGDVVECEIEGIGILRNIIT